MTDPIFLFVYERPHFSDILRYMRIFFAQRFFEAAYWFRQYFIQHFSHIHSIILYGTGFDKKKLRAYVNHLKAACSLDIQ